jgi:ribosomal protein S18 acetylase RimI-like enzyme
MTTTLRPTEPLQRFDDGARSRHYQVCVNGRPVGAVHLATHPEFGPAVAVVRELHIEGPDRGRGRGAVAALATEEVARAWGCSRIEVSVPAASDHACRLAAALGYVEGSRNMDKPLAASRPVLPTGGTCRPLAQAEYGTWLAAGKEREARSWTRRGVPPAEAKAKADDDYARLLPQGLATERMFLRVLEHQGAAVGTLWLALREAAGLVLNVEVGAEHRGKGHGRTLMLLAESAAADAGMDRIGLHVFADNATALGLYVSLGYRPIKYHLYKPLV